MDIDKKKFNDSYWAAQRFYKQWLLMKLIRAKLGRKLKKVEAEDATRHTFLYKTSINYHKKPSR